MDTNTEDLKQFTLKGDGGTIAVTEDRLNWLKDEFRHIMTYAGWSVNDRRLLSEDTRYCRWPGQSADGRKHENTDNGRPAFPFEGASDVRLRLADEIVMEQVILIMASVMRMQLKFTSPDPAKSKLGDQLATLWEWTKANQLKREWFFELRRLLQFRQGDSPAVGIMQVYWKEETSLQLITVTAEEAIAEVIKAAADRGDQVTQDVENSLEAAFKDPAQEDLLTGIIAAHWPDISPARAKKAAKDMVEEGQATFPYPVAKKGRAALRARRLMDDMFVPDNTDQFQRCRVMYVREWFTATELMDKDRKGEFLPGFVEEVLKHEGETCWRHYTHFHVNGDYSDSIIERAWDRERYRGQYELLTAHFKAANKDGITGIYSVRYHFAVEQPGSDMELAAYQDGDYMFTEFSREVTTGRLWDTRGIAELSMTEQQALKTLHDSFIDHSQLSTVPPIKVPASRPKMALVIRPLGLIKENRPGEINFMTPPAYPATNDKANERINARVDRYFGRMADSNSKDWIRVYGQDLVDMFLIDLVEVVRKILQLQQQFMDVETLQRVLGPDAVPIAKTVEEIQGQFDVELSFDAGMLSLEYVKIIAGLVTDYAFKWDDAGLIRRDELENWFFSSLSPALARRLLRTIKSANQNEVSAAQQDFVKIKAGIEPDRPTEGVDFDTRLNTILGIGQSNPEAFATLTPTSRKILEEHIKYLQGQVQQEQNAVIGREMAGRTLPAPGAQTMAPAAAAVQ